jgi:hypothetical protein
MGYSGQTMLNAFELEREAAIKSVVNNQAHRIGISDNPNDAWRATALGRFCERYWSREPAKEHWEIGERYARLVDDELASHGFRPRQCAVSEYGNELTVEEQLEKRRIAEERLEDAESAMRRVDYQTPGLVKTLAWEDMELPADKEGRVRHGLYFLRLHFEALDTRKRVV